MCPHYHMEGFRLYAWGNDIFCIGTIQFCDSGNITEVWVKRGTSGISRTRGIIGFFFLGSLKFHFRV